MRIDPATHEKLTRLAEEADVSLAEALSRAVDVYETQQFFAKLKAQYAALRADPVAWKDERDERALWDEAAAADAQR